MRETGWSVLFSGLTTIVALLSFLSVMLKPIRSVGILSSIAVGFILLVALTISPILLSFGKDKKPNAKVLERGDTRMGVILDSIGKFVLGHGKPIAIVFAVVTAISVFGLTKIEPAFDVERTMGRKVEYVNKMLYVAESEIGSFFGIFNAFSVIAVSGLSDAGAFAIGIKLAHITTVIGLVVAIPHVIAFNYLNASMESEQDNVENDVLLQLGRILKEKDHIRSLETASSPTAPRNDVIDEGA